jgi:isoquinoline 1-oxidoreductase beta subunit
MPLRDVSTGSRGGAFCGCTIKGEKIMNRRQFLQMSLTVGGSLLIGIDLAANETKPETISNKKSFNPNAWIRIDPNNKIVFQIDRSEMGQGVMTSLAMLIAEEMEVDLDQITTEFAPAGDQYRNTMIGMQLTGGSTSIREGWEKLRRAGAVAKTLLIEAAAQTWDVPKEECVASKGRVSHKENSFNYGDLVARAAKLPLLDPSKVDLKSPADFKLLGKKTQRLDLADKVNGKAQFGIDVKIPEMLIASVIRPPMIGGKLKSFDDSEVRKINGIRHVVKTTDGIAVVADNFWLAQQGVKALKVEWSGGDEKLSSEGILESLKEASANDKPVIAKQKGSIKTAKSDAAKTLEVEYLIPFQAHACMEPLNCTAHVKKDSCEIWVGTQNQTGTLQIAKEITGLEDSAIKIHTTYLGGGFGRRGEKDFVRDAVEISKAIDSPVKAIWTREQDMQNDVYRPNGYNKLSAFINKNNELIGWQQRIVSPSIFMRAMPNWLKDGLDHSSVEGSGADLPYDVKNLFVDYVVKNQGNVPVGFWRSVGHSQNAFVTESFVDEIAHACGKDPVEFRRMLLKDQPRHLGVLELAAEKGNWGQPLAKGEGRGIAVHHSFGSYCAQVAEIAVDKGGNVRVKRVVCAIDCGQTVNPDTIEAQMQSAIVYGLTAALHSSITIKNGKIQQTNFDNFPLLKMSDMPQVEVYIVESKEKCGGVGEPGLPPIAPAVANAIFYATNKRIRQLPIKPSDLA